MEEKSEEKCIVIEDGEMRGLSTLPMTPIRKLLVFGALLSAVFCGSLDETIVASVATNMASEFHAVQAFSWIAISYMLCLNATEPLYGKLSDIFGRKAMMIVALVIFLAGTIGCGVATNIAMLLAFRAISGIGGSGMIGLSFIIVAEIIPICELLKKTYTFTAFMTCPVCSDLSSVEYLSWRWCFYICIPLGAISLVAVVSMLPAEPSGTAFLHKLKRVDFGGAILLVASMVCLLIPISLGGDQYAWDSPVSVTLLVLAGVGLVAFVLVEIHVAAEPIIAMRLFRNPNTVASLMTLFFLGMSFTGFLYYLPVWFIVVDNRETSTASYRLLPIFLGITIFGIVSGFLSEHVAKRLPRWLPAYTFFIHLGNLFFLAGTISLSFLHKDISSVAEIMFLIVFGIGLGLVLQMAFFSCQVAIDPKDIAVVNGLAVSFQNLGGSLGIAIMGNIQASRLRSAFTQMPEGILAPSAFEDVRHDPSLIYTGRFNDTQRSYLIDAYEDSLQLAFKVAIAFTAMCVLPAFFIKRVPISKSEEEEAGDTIEVTSQAALSPKAAV
ncbi:uncharacterized protein SPPG_08199 [Spizellomyces punctatus DAOM BR117]|uniref:Major facilitator superfamily (MFS) profile domain-containing protein n=1 Tax=Spizellomyces punctatus (strain DAOM BR117) TaxID=645134 RepID=A0A0L0H5Z1_SPIPD|nr:uncharacterized protein SPPG_08199 [Spizellomyces punctatus DAOM BR117]KNC96617.1 hypothetical protein SPPG_08199 [Spizellomyces punctatus DAOM BR117]|eukprot:XP_016604657.1 hypothetical protein SPPG_08199 [Spizellomyces punctatus DAOM BR117]